MLHTHGPYQKNVSWQAFKKSVKVSVWNVLWPFPCFEDACAFPVGMHPVGHNVGEREESPAHGQKPVLRRRKCIHHTSGRRKYQTRSARLSLANLSFIPCGRLWFSRTACGTGKTLPSLPSGAVTPHSRWSGDLTETWCVRARCQCFPRGLTYSPSHSDSYPHFSDDTVVPVGLKPQKWVTHCGPVTPELSSFRRAAPRVLLLWSAGTRSLASQMCHFCASFVQRPPVWIGAALHYVFWEEIYRYQLF